MQAKLKKEKPPLVSVTTQQRLTAADGKRYNTDVLDFDVCKKISVIFSRLIEKVVFLQP